MKTTSAGYTAHVALSTQTVRNCLKCTRVDGTVFGFTDHDRSLSISGTTYVPGFRPFAVKSETGKPGNTDIQAGFGSARVTAADIAAGLWDYCLVEHFRVNWSDLTQGVEKVSKGRLGQISRGRTGFTAELLGLMAHLDQIIGVLTSPACRAEFGDARCKVDLDPPTWAVNTPYTVRSAFDAGVGSTVKPSVYNGRYFERAVVGTSHATTEPTWNLTIGVTTDDNGVVGAWITRQALTVEGTVTSVLSRASFYDSSRNEAADFFRGGKVTFTSGLNDGLSMEVKEYPGGSPNGLVVLHLEFPYDIAPGDAYTMTAGCAFDKAACKVHRNIYNMRAEPDLPGTDYLMTGKAA